MTADKEMPMRAKPHMNGPKSGFEDNQRKLFPHGYNPMTASLLLLDLIATIQTMNEDTPLPGNTTIDPVVYAARALAAALVDAIEDIDFGERVT